MNEECGFTIIPKLELSQKILNATQIRIASQQFQFFQIWKTWSCSKFFPVTHDFLLRACSAAYSGIFTADRFLCCVAVSLSTVAAGKIKGEEVEQKNKKIKITAEKKWKVDARLISMFEQIQI